MWLALLQTYAEMDPTTAALEKEHEAVSTTPKPACNPLRAIFFRENINIYLHFMSFFHTNKTQVVEIPPRVRQGSAYST